jgi:translocation and assembly module TamB
MERARYKKTLWFLTGFAAFLLLAVAAMPLWLPWLLRPVARSYGLTFQTYDRLSYGRFAAQGVTFSNKNVTLKAARVETLVPTAWLWERWFAEPSASSVWDWELTTRASEKRSGRAPSTYTNFQRTDKVLIALRRWLPAAALTNGTVKAGDVVLQFPSATWNGGVLTSRVADPRRQLRANLRGTVGSNGISSLAIASDSLSVRLDRVKSRGTLKIGGTLQWLTNSVQLGAEFGHAGLLPDHAALKADTLTVPARFLRLNSYEDLRGTVSAVWQDGAFQIQSSATAEASTNTFAPPLAIELRARGDTNSAVIEAARIVSSAITAEIAEPALVRYQPPYLEQSLTLNASAALEQQRWFPATGHLSARALIFPSITNVPAANFQVSGSGIQIANMPLQSMETEGELRWPFLRFGSVTVQLAEGARAEARGEIDLSGKSLVNGSLALSAAHGHPLLPRWLTVSNLALTASASGPFEALQHSGRLRADAVETLRTRPASFDAAWEGQHLIFANVDLKAVAGQSTLFARLAAEVDKPERSIRIDQFTLATNDHEVLRLTSPTAISLSGATNETQWALSVSPIQLTGDTTLALGGEIRWPWYGHITNTLLNLDPRVFQDFVRSQIPASRIEHLELAAEWDRGPAAFTLNARSVVMLTNENTFSIDARLAGTSNGVTLEKVAISTGNSPVVSGEGFLPMAIDPQRGLQLHDQRDLNFRFSTLPDATIWNALADRLGVALEDPNVSALLGGSWKEPHGSVHADIGQIRFVNPPRPLPITSNLLFAAEVTRDGIELTQGRVELAGRSIEATAKLPLGENFWESIESRKLDLDWKQIKARLVIPQIDLHPFAAALPAAIAPQGRFHADLTLSGGEVTGVFRIQDVRTRPLPSLGPLRDLDVRARFEGSEIKLQPIAATVGGRQVHGEGTIHLPPRLWPTNGLPDFHFRAWGANVPLVRRPEAIVRADLELEITNAASMKAPEIRGGVNLRKSYFLTDLNDLVPGKVASPRRRPPYFSITNARFADWRLAIDVRGDEFIKIRSPLFRGMASPTLRLEGTLQEPAALGEIKIDSGRVTFPFASFDVTQGFVTLSSADPYRPHLNLLASTRRIGYDLKLEVTGPADEPVVQFSSSPPLSSEQIVLMVTAGQMPTETARLTTEQRAQRMALFIGGNLLTEFGIGGAGEERLTVRSGEQLTETGKQTYEVEYKLMKDLSLVGQYDRFNEFNAGLKWRVYSR